jgi:sugar phosphate isomerase/epimerase
VIAELGGAGVVTPAAYGMYTRKLPPFDPPPRTDEEDADVLVAALRELGEHAAAEGVAVFFEPLNRYEDHMVNTLARGAELCRAAGSAGIRLVADTYHMNIEEDDPAASVREFGDLIGHVQLGDSARWQPGTGHVDFGAFVTALHDVGFEGWLALECNLRGDPMAALAQGAAVMRPLIEPRRS